MELVACFLRAVNVGGRRATNEQLVAAAATAGFDDARAYQAAGNLVVPRRGRGLHEVERVLGDALADALGFEVAVVARDRDGLAAAVAGVPWDEPTVDRSRGRPQVVLCRHEPTPATVREVLALAGDDDLFAVVGRDLHWLPLAGTGRTAVDTRRLHELLGPATARTVGTLDRIHARFFAT